MGYLKIDENIDKKLSAPEEETPKKELELETETTIDYLSLHSRAPPLNVRSMTLEEFATRHFKNHLLECRQEPITTPFLHKSDEIDFRLSVEIFKLILKYMNDRALDQHKLDQLAQYIVKQAWIYYYIRFLKDKFKNYVPENRINDAQIPR